MAPGTVQDVKCWARGWVLPVGLLLAGAGVATANVDLTGAWTSAALPSFTLKQVPASPYPKLFLCGNTGTLASGVLARGVVDSASGAFDLFFDSTLTPVCSEDWNATAAPDGNSFTGTATVSTLCSVPLCNPPRCNPPTMSPVLGNRTGPAAGACCGDGVVDPGEECDDGIPPSGSPTGCCSTNCTFLPRGHACQSDGNVCTDDVCDGAGTCQHLPNTAPCAGPCSTAACAGGLCMPGTPLPLGTACDRDANVCTQDTCDGAGTCVAGPTVVCAGCLSCDPQQGCIAAPSTGCHSDSQGALLDVRTGTTAARRKVRWQWNAVNENLADFGDPLATTDYRLCVYIEPAGPSAVTLAATAPAGGMCGKRSCWVTHLNGFRYADPELTPDGLHVLSIVAKPLATARITVTGRGANLALPGALPIGSFGVAELRAITGGSMRCWQSGFTAPPAISTAQRFIAKRK